MLPSPFNPGAPQQVPGVAPGFSPSMLQAPPQSRPPAFVRPSPQRQGGIPHATAPGRDTLGRMMPVQAAKQHQAKQARQSSKAPKQQSAAVKTNKTPKSFTDSIPAPKNIFG